MSEVFASVTGYKFPPIYDDSEVNVRAVVAFLDLRRDHVASALGISVESVRYDERMSTAIRDFILKCAAAIDHVAQYFSDQPIKIKTWFFTRNPMLGGMSAVGLIKLGRIDQLLQFIIDAKSGDLP